ncbi:LacI family DNA-binding transcriptional regulator [Paenibacillus validus]|uniref:LacI family DNA-binding transcriptional regulator n=1 Tax=Paenibacillus validus TaxID=44253 RepID=A0A7X2Z6T6_9BACL|nr:LacI family DNA-binding transcriptional regulator [Paenibacillus validus]MUG69418.1 LacI family DNA-binding transcriptional regulator [Paenibacillus validus]
MATINDVALKAGVSVTTVSRVLNNRGYISEATRRKVYECMDELGYRPNEIARSLLKKQSNLIGLILPSVSHPFFGELATHLEYYAHQYGFKLLLCNSLLDPNKEREYIDMMKRNRVDGIIMGSHTLEVGEYKHINRPVVTMDRRIGDNIPFVASDNYRGGELATKLLVGKGCKKIAHICGNLELNLLANQRSEAFKNVVNQSGTDHVMIQTDMNVFDQSQYERIIEELLQQHPDIDGVFATSDIIAAFVVQICRRLGKDVPRDVRVVGYDDVNAASWMFPSLSTIRQPIEAMSRLAIDLIQRQLDESEFDYHNILPVELIEREST